MISPTLSAAAAATLAMGLPMALAAWAHWTSRRAAVSALRAAPARDSGRIARLAFVAHLAAVAAATLWVAAYAARADAAPGNAVRAVLLFLAAAALAAAAPLRPLLGPLAYALASYALPRQDEVTRLLFSVHAESLLAGLAALALVPWSFRTGRRLSPPRETALMALGLFTCWVGVAVVAAIVAGRPAGDGMAHRAGRIVQCLVLCLVARQAQPTLRDVHLFVVVVAAMLGLRAGLFTDGVRLEQNLAALVAVTIPWAAGVLLSVRRWWARLACLPVVGGLVALVVVIANRGAVLGLAAGAVAVWAASPWRWRLAALAAPAALVLFGLLSQTQLGARLDSAYEQGGFQESAAARLDLWQLGLDLARRHPIVGVGPENYSHYFNETFDVDWDMSAHNMFIDVMAETGYVGLALFAAVWILASIALARAAGQAADSRTKAILLAGLAGAWTYLVTGSFLSLASLALAYVFLGIALSAAADPAFAGAAVPPKSPPVLSAGQATRRDLDFVALLYTIAVVLGSLAPFQFQSLGPTAAVSRVLELDWLPTQRLSRVDLVSNFLLFVPLGFLVMGSLTCDLTDGLRRAAGLAATLAGCIGVGVSVEVLQCWFPSRTVSAQDVIAQTVGTLLGAAAWLLVGQRGVNFWRRWKVGRADLTATDRALIIYVLALLVWTAWPLEITLHPVELWHKYQGGWIKLFAADDLIAPFAGGLASPAAGLVLAAPVGWLLASVWRRTGAAIRAWRHVVVAAIGGAAAIEILRVMAPEHTASGDQMLVTFSGILLGAAIQRRVAASGQIA